MTEIDFNPQHISKNIFESGKSWAKANAQANLLEEQGKVLLAKITQDLVNNGSAITLATATAKADPRWSVHIEGLCVAQERSNEARAHYIAMQEYSNNMRTVQVTKREEMKLL